VYPRSTVARILPDVLTEADFPVEFGRYTLQGILGEGGMARVFKAEMSGPEGFKKAAAVKIVRSSLAADNDRLRTSLINEARLGGLLHHPNIVDTYDFGDVHVLPYIAMEYVRGIGLEQVLAAVSPLPAEVAFEIAIQMCAGLDHAHNLEDVEGDSELVHRDLKPSNVLLSRDGLVKVMDFGIAKATAVSSTNTATGMTKGTPSYMSPEQVNGEALDRRSDLFAVGAILYELFTGKRLFNADSLMSILMSVMQVEERLAASGALDELDLIALGLSDVVRKCLRRNATDRWDDAADLEHELKLLARTIDPPPPMKKWVRGLMAQGLGNVGESSINTAPPRVAGGVAPQTLKTDPTPLHPDPPAAVAAFTQVPAASAEVPATRAQVLTPTGSGGAPPVSVGMDAAPEPVAATRPQTRVPPPHPPATDPAQIAGGPPPGTLWMGDEPPSKNRPVLLILLGLLLGGGIAVLGAIGAIVFLGDDGGTEYASSEPTLDPLPDLAALDDGDASADAAPVADARTSRRSPAPRETQAREPEPAREAEPEPDPVAVAEPEPTPEPVAPEPDPEPVEAATPERARPPRETRRRDRAPDRTTERTPEPTPEPRTSHGEPSLRSVTGAVLGRDGSDVKVRFSAKLKGSCDDPRVTVHFNPPGAKWVKRSLHEVDGAWLVNVPFARKNQGKVYWYVSAVCDGRKKLAEGSADKPRKLKVE